MDIRLSRPLLVAFLASGLALASQPTLAQHKQDKHDKQDQTTDQAAEKGKGKGKQGDAQAGNQAAQRQDEARAQPRKDEARQQPRKDEARAQSRQDEARQQRNAERQAPQRDAQARHHDAQARHHDDQRAFQASHEQAKAVVKQQKFADKADRKNRRLSEQQQRQLISQQKVRVSEYRVYTTRQQDVARQVASQLQAQNRLQQYQFVNTYQQRLLQQQLSYRNQGFNYDNDPYFYSAPSYRYQRGGSYYEVNQYGADVLRQAVNAGYNEGYQSGRADRMDRWHADYRNAFAYQDASYGYNGYYLSRNDYSYYFRQGFQKGYDDGYYSRSQYGRSRNGSYSILGTILTSILGLQSY